MNRICPWTSRFLHTRYFSITIYIRSPEIFEFYSTSYLRVLNNGKKKEKKRKKEKGKRKSNRRWTDSAIFPLSPICKVQCLLVATPPGYLNYSWKWKRYFSRGGMQLRRGGRSFLKGNLIFFFFLRGSELPLNGPAFKRHFTEDIVVQGFTYIARKIEFCWMNGKNVALSKSRWSRWGKNGGELENYRRRDLRWINFVM